MIRVGLVGYGFMGKMHSECYAAAGAKVAAVADGEADRRQDAAAKLGCKAFDNVQALLDGSEVDLIDVCTPTYLHEEIIMAGASAGKNVFCEKPLSISNESCDRIVSKVKETGVKFMTGHVVRFWPECIVLKKTLDSGRLGKPVWASARRLSPPATWAWQGWLGDPAKSGGAVLDLHIHDIDFLSWILGPPNRVFSTGLTTEKGALDTALTILIGDVSGEAEASLAMPEGFPFTNSILVVCEKGSVVFDLNSEHSLIVRPAGQPEEYPEVPQPVAKSTEAGGNVSSLGGYYNEIAYFLDCLKEDRQPEIITPEEAAFAVRLCLAARKSAETGEVVTL